jgi:hypothetical protein
MSTSRKRIDWNYHLRQQPLSRLSVKDYCAREGFSSWSFYTNRQRVKPLQTLAVPSQLQPATTSPTPHDISFFNIGTIHRPHVTVRFPDATVIEYFDAPDPAHLTALVVALKARESKRGESC